MGILDGSGAGKDSMYEAVFETFHGTIFKCVPVIVFFFTIFWQFRDNPVFRVWKLVGIYISTLFILYIKKKYLAMFMLGLYSFMMRDIYEKASTNPISNESVANLNKFVCFINNIAGIIFVVCSYIGQFVNKDVLGIVHLDLDIFTEIEQNAVMLVTYSMLYIALNSIYTKIAFTKMSFQLTNFDIDAVQISEPKNNYYIHCTLCGISKATIMRTHFEKIASAEISPRIVGKCKHKFNERDTDSWAIVWITSKIPIIILKRNVTVRNIKFGRALHSTADLIQFVVESVLIWLPIAGISVLSYTAYCIGDYETILKEIRRFYMWAMKIEVE